MKKVIIKRINLQSFVRATVMFVAIPTLFVGVLILAVGVVYSLFSNSAVGVSITDTITQLVWFIIPYAINPLIFIFLSMFCVISYNHFAPKVGGLELDIENSSIVETTKLRR